MKTLLHSAETERSSWLKQRGPALACFFTAAIVALLVSGVLLRMRTGALGVLAGSTAAVIVVFVVSVLAGRASFALFLPRIDIQPGSVLFPFAAVGLWFGPLALATHFETPWAAIGAGVLAAAIGRVLGRFESVFSIDQAGDGDLPLAVPSLLSDVVMPPVSSRLPEAWGVAVLLQLAIVGVLWGWYVAALLSFCFGCFLAGWMARTISMDQEFQWSRTKLSANLLLAMLFTVVFTLFNLRRESGSSNVMANYDDAHAGAGNHVGVILTTRPHDEAHITPPSRLRFSTAVQPQYAEEQSFAFSGEYWIYPWPMHRPSANSEVRQGSPLLSVFSEVDRYPILMRAHQILNEPIQLACCAGIDLAVVSTDTEEEAIFVELVVIDNQGPEGTRKQSLGVAGFSAATGAPATNAQSNQERLRFDIPAIRQFDEMEVIFHLYPPRGFRSARVAINRVYLMPGPVIGDSVLAQRPHRIQSCSSASRN